MPLSRPLIVAAIVAFGGSIFFAQDYKPNLPSDDAAVAYGRGADDPVSRLQHAVERGTVSLPSRDGVLGVLPALLDRLHVSADSQMLVFSKTSFQAARISPDVPRAIYFGDDVMVGYVPGAPTLEIAAMDPGRGPIFYTMATSGARPIARGDTCLHCHQGPNTAGVAGVYVGSVVPGPTGTPLGDESAIITDHRTPFRDRWGGWYVTAKRGEQADRANAVASNPADPEALVRNARQNLSSLAPLVDVSAYLAPTSDIVALMTFEHQTQALNLITRVSWDARLLAAGRLADRELDADVDDLVSYMLFAGEAPLAEPIEGGSSFARTFESRGPRDRRGRSLRDFDLRTRLFRHPLSYLIYSASFDAIPAAVRERVYRGLFAALTAHAVPPAYAHLSPETRRAILEIVAETKIGVPTFWKRFTTRPAAENDRRRH